MLLAEVQRVVAALEAAGCSFWLEGGWGVDALVGHQTREHRDVDVDIDARHEEAALGALAVLGYAIETDWRPNRVELVAPGRGWVDLHLLVIDASGVRQAALGGGWHEFPPDCFTTGHLDGHEVPCFTAETQRFFRTGYEPRPVDLHDLALLDDLG